MKKIIAVLLCFAVIFAFAACTKKAVDGETTTAVELPANVITDANGNPETVTSVSVVYDADGKPKTTYVSEYKTYPAGAWVTDSNGMWVTQTEQFLVLDDNGEPMVDENGVPITTYAYNNVTYPAAPGETLPPKTTKPAGYTTPSENAKWPADAFMAKLPKLKDNVDKAIGSTNKNGNFKNIQINELSYADYLKYIETCKKAGFVQTNTGTVIPSKSEAGECYRYQSVANGLYVTLTYYTDEYPYRTCDLLITVSDYDMMEAIS